MTQRNLHLQLAADTLRAIEDNPGEAVHLARGLVIAMLAPQHKQLWEYLIHPDNFKHIRPRDVEDRFGWSYTHASTMLKDLYEVGLLKRTEHRDKVGREFWYTVKK